MLSNRVREILNTELIAVEASSTVSEAMSKMSARDVGRVIVIRDDLPVGIFTERHVLKHVAGGQLDPDNVTVEQIMTSPFRAVSEETRIVDALGVMLSEKIRHLQVLGARQNIVGIVSMRRILEIAVELGRNLHETKTVGSLISRPPLFLDQTKSVRDAITVMIQSDAGAVIITDKFKPVGIFTERDVLNRVMVRQLDGEQTKLREVMTWPLITMPGSALVGAVLDQMYRSDIRNLPIVGDWNHLLGMVSMQDVLQYARAFNIDEEVRRTWKEIHNFYDSQDEYTPG